MAKKSAGIITYRKTSGEELEILLVHPGGPFFQKKDDGVWSIPKGEYSEGENPVEVAKREFEEETGNTIRSAELIELHPVRIKSGKEIIAWLVEENFEQPYKSSNTFELEWPPRSGKIVSFPEADNAAWFTLAKAKEKITSGQILLLEQIEQLIEQMRI